MRSRQRRTRGAPLWAVTFSDMMSLLLALFILLVAFTRLDAERFREFSGSVSEALGGRTTLEVPVASRDAPTTEVPQAAFSAADTSEALRALVDRQRQRAPGGAAVLETFVDGRGVVLRVGEEAMFSDGRAEVRPSMWPLLDDVAILAVENRARVQVEAHTDARPIRTAEFPSNDHLAGARALSVIRYLRGIAPGLDESGLEAVPLGDTRPLVPETGDAARARNRRVELIFRDPALDERPGQSPPR